MPISIYVHSRPPLFRLSFVWWLSKPYTHVHLFALFSNTYKKLFLVQQLCIWGEIALTRFFDEVHHWPWKSFLMNDNYNCLPRYLFPKGALTFPNILRPVFEMAKLGSIPSWYQKVGFPIGSQMVPQETQCCNVTNVSLERGSPINSSGWTTLMSNSIFLVVVSKASLLWNAMTKDPHCINTLEF